MKKLLFIILFITSFILMVALHARADTYQFGDYTGAQMAALFDTVNAMSADGASLTAAANYAAMRALLDLEPATDFYSIAAANAAFLEATQLDDTKGNGDTAYLWSADKTYDQLALKEPLITTDSIDAITEIAAALKTGSDTKLVTGTAGTSTYHAVWNADGDLVGGVAPLATTHDTAGELDALYVLRSAYTQDSGILVGTGAGTFAEETGATLRTSIGVGTGDSPQFTGIELSHATENTVSASGGVLSIEGKTLVRTEDINTAAKLETVANLGAYASDILGCADQAAFGALVPTLNQNTTGTAANLSGTPALPNGVTATTQSASDNTTKLATTAYADAQAALQIANVVEDTTPQLGGNLDTNTKYILDTAPSGNLTAGGGAHIRSVTVDTSPSVGYCLTLSADEHYDLADASDNTKLCRVLALETGTGTKTVLRKGEFRDDSKGYTPGADIYLSETSGQLVEAVPTTVGSIDQVVGYAISSTIIYFDPSFYYSVKAP